jgi:hypothetical protein
MSSEEQRTSARVTPSDHAARMKSLLREYLSSMFSCLPASTLVVVLAPYHSTKAPWEAPLVQATYEALLFLVEEGVLQRNRILFLDTMYLTLCSGTRSSDGNHYDSNMQTAVWTLLAHALKRFKGTPHAGHDSSKPDLTA